MADLPTDGKDHEGAPLKPPGETAESDLSELSEDLSETAIAPSLVTHGSAPSAAPLDVLNPGSRIDDFEVERVLGRGGFGVVYLATQISLNRQVALKVTVNVGSEGRTMAQLEHENIVQVFSESISADGRCRLLCMQYIPGATLDAVIARMHGDTERNWSGDSILQLLDELHSDPLLYHPGGLRERQELSTADSVEAVCWIGARLADALAYAHRKGILHRDIKPANILQTRYGRPMLADFNLAFQSIELQDAGKSLFGGTLAYMSPEHLDAFHPSKPASAEVVDARSDIYSLGVVLYELSCGNVGLPAADSELDVVSKLEAIAAARRTPPPRLENAENVTSRVLDRTIRRCLQPDPGKRYQDAAELAASLDGCREMSEIERELPVAGPLTRFALRRPFLSLIVLSILPHLPVGSTVNISYNLYRIVGHLTEPQQAAFQQLLLFYNGLLYSICFALLGYLLYPVYHAWKELHSNPQDHSPQVVAAARRRTTSWPVWVVVLACVGWMPAGLFFPTALHLVAGPIPGWVFVHFMISCSLSGLIAMTYSYFAIQYLAMRVFYPRLWSDVAHLRQQATAELAGVAGYQRLFQVLAGLVPLSGAILVVALGPEQEEGSYAVFQFLVITLIVLGFGGFLVSNRVSELITQTLTALTERVRADRTLR